VEDLSSKTTENVLNKVIFIILSFFVGIVAAYSFVLFNVFTQVIGFFTGLGNWLGYGGGGTYITPALYINVFLHALVFLVSPFFLEKFNRKYIIIYAIPLVIIYALYIYISFTDYPSNFASTVCTKAIFNDTLFHNFLCLLKPFLPN